MELKKQAPLIDFSSHLTDYKLIIRGGDRMKKNWLVFKARFLTTMKIYFRYPVNFIMTLFEPIMWLAPFYFMGKSFETGGKLPGFEQYTGNSDFIGFLVTGYMITRYVETVFWTMGFSLKNEMREGVLESNWSAPVSRIVLMTSKSTFNFVVSTLEIIITGVICHFIFGFKITPNILEEIAFLIPGIIGMLGLGLIIASLVLLAKEANGIIDITSSLVSALSGSFFPIKVLPKFFLTISLSIPLTYIYDSSRAILIGQTPIMPLKIEFILILIFMVVFMALGSFVFMKTEKRCRTLGTLGTH